MKFLLAYDGTAHSHYALEKAAALGREHGAAVTVLSVVPPEARGSKSGGHVGLPPHSDEDVALAEAFLQERGVATETKVAHGNPADQILAEAEARGYDAIVMGTRGLGSVAGLLLGSVSRKVVKDAPCPVIVAGEAESTRFEAVASEN